MSYKKLSFWFLKRANAYLVMGQCLKLRHLFNAFALVVLIQCLFISPAFAAIQCKDIFNSHFLTSPTEKSSSQDLKDERHLGVADTPPVEQFLTQIPAVHATDIFPLDGIITAGKQGDWYAQTPYVSATVHFALGGLVPPHSTGDWEKSSFAIIAPLGDVAPRAINFFAHDTSVLGNFPISNRAIIIVPSDFVIPPNFKYKTIRSEKNETLRNAVNRVIKEQGYWQAQMEPHTGFNGDAALIGDLDINDDKVFEKMKEVFPQLSKGTSMNNPFHQYYYYFSLLLDHLFRNPPSFCSAPDLENSIKALDFNTGLFREALKNPLFSSDARSFGEHVASELDQWMYLLRFELYLQKAHGVSLLVRRSENSKVRNQLIALRKNPKDLKEYIDKLLNDKDFMEKNRIAMNPHESNPNLSYILTLDARLLQNLSLDEFIQFSNGLNHGDWTPVLTAKFNAWYVQARLQRADINDVESNRLLEFVNESILNLSANERTDVVISLVRSYERYLHTQSDRKTPYFKRFEKLMNLPTLQGLFRII